MTALLERPTIEKPAVAKQYTTDDFEALLEIDDENHELIDGEWIEMSGASGRHSEVASIIDGSLRMYAKANKLGRVFVNVPIALNAVNEPRPDVAFVAAGKIPDDFEGPVPAVPDLVVEVNSPSDTTKSIHEKLVMYRASRVPLIWLVFLLDRYVLVHRLDNPNVQLLNLNDELDGEDVLPGFKLKVSTIFEL